MRITKAQAQAIAKLYSRIENPEFSYIQFRRTVQGTFGMDHAIVIRFCGMWIAIETDGYCHS
jgi:hypothetical protein